MPVPTAALHWTEAHSVNIAELDRQHQKLLETVNELNDALRSREGQSAVGKILERLVQYAGEHFTAEEALMERHGFPGLPMHRAQHESFRQKLAGFLDDYRAGKAGVPVSLLLFMNDWVRQHMMKTDKRYSRFLNARGVR